MELPYKLYFMSDNISYSKVKYIRIPCGCSSFWARSHGSSLSEIFNLVDTERYGLCAWVIGLRERQLYSSTYNHDNIHQNGISPPYLGHDSITNLNNGARVKGLIVLTQGVAFMRLNVSFCRIPISAALLVSQKNIRPQASVVSQKSTVH